MNAPLAALRPGLSPWSGPRPAPGHAAGLRLAFLHIPKTAGTAFGAALAQRFASNDSLERMRLAASAGAFGTLLPDLAQRFRLIGIGNHLDRDKLDAIAAALPAGERLFTVTLLREPRARLISQYRHWRRDAGLDRPETDPDYRELLRAARELPLGEFLAARLPRAEWHMGSMQARMLAGLVTSELLDDAAILAAARASLATIDVVGTTDAVDDALARVAEAYGWPAPDAVRPLNVAAGAPPPLDDTTEALIEEATRLDRALWLDLQGAVAEPPPARPAHGYFHPAPALLDGLLRGATTRFTMDMPLHGEGWHVREGAAPTARWTGPGRRSTILLDLPLARRVEVSLQLVSVLDWAAVEGVALTLDGLPPEAPPAVVVEGAHPWLRASFALPVATARPGELAIEVPFTTSHAALDPAVPDHRQKGLAIGDIALRGLPEAVADGLGGLFWPGRAWSEQPRAALLDLLTLEHAAAPVIASDRHLGLDLRLLGAILDLVAPDHVWVAERRASVLAPLLRGTPEAPPAPGATLAVVTSLFDLPGRGRVVATLAARFEHATLLLACAEDHRLRALLANPVLAPHLHLVGCTNAILIADLAGLRRAGGNEMLQGVLLLIERIGDTAPEVIRTHAPDVALGHILRQAGAALDEIAAPPAPGAVSPGLAALLPATAAPPAPETLRARFLAIRGAPGSPVALADAALLDALAGQLDALAAAPAGSDAAWHAARAAHDRAFRLAGMVAGWRAFGLAGTATGALAAALREGAPKPPIAPKPLKPFAEYIDFYRGEARIMARGGHAPTLRLSLDTLGGGLDHVVRLHQAAREVELALLLLSRRFPGEEILWVDAGCSYGVLLNAVEPPSALQGRCRFLGFDFNAPGIAAARTAAANAGRAHCSFEVGDVAEAGGLVGSRRIHLLTAFEVLEHCPDPLRVLRDYRALDPGMLVVGSPLSEPQGVLPAEQHLWTFEAEGYASLVREAGFAPIGVTCREVGRFVGGHDWVTVTATTGEPGSLAVL